jgi:choline-sulfatase
MFLSDHGDYVAAHGLWAKGLPCFREAYQIPLLMKIPGVRGGGRIDSLVSITDVAPTILDIVGLEPFAQGGDSLLPLLENKEVPWRTELFSQTNGNEVYGIQRSIWNTSWKYVLNTFDYDELYDLQNDPDELHNLAKQPEMQPIIKEMCKKLWAFAKEHDDNCTCPYIMVGLAPYGPGILLE